MDNLLIGALELGDRLESYGDGALEAVAINPNPTQLALGTNCCTHWVSDGVLEGAGADTALSPTSGALCLPTGMMKCI